MQSSNKSVLTTLAIHLLWLTKYRFYNAHETSAAEDFAIALLCGEAEFKASQTAPALTTPASRGSVANFPRCMLVL